MFDHIYAVYNGRCLYSGGTDELIPFLAKHGLQCPQYHNPADYLLEITSMSEFVSYIPKLVSAIEDGNCKSWRRKQSECQKAIEEEPANREPVPKLPDGKVSHRTYQTAFWKQIYVLMKRQFKKIYRDMLFTYLQLTIHVLFGILIGICFYDIGNDAAFINDNFSLIFFCIMFNMFTSYSSTVAQYPQELPVLVREHFNKWYSFKAYFVATTFSGFPVQLVCSLLYTSIVYFMTAQPLEVDRFSKSMGIVLLVAFIAQGFGYLIASTLSVQNASVFGGLVTTPFLLFSGYFVLIPDSPYSLKWIFHMSYFKYALEGMMVAILGDHRPKMKCSDDYCHYIMPNKFLRQVGMEFSDFWFSFGVLFGIGLFLRIITYYSLQFRIKYFKK
ncbi:UNVERIFIED_CONTAM: hypothetical protein PYX00_009619 [Menopon gallinae]|uniref:ABC-2 type transporter transmembrane domain-containing protein n=1 Tax=Menopon gallinae TaxID=328185 RepID=A0AAW2HC80_9NEOP